MIRVEINGSDICQNEKNGGVCGEGNSTDMEIAFVSLLNMQTHTPTSHL